MTGRIIACNQAAIDRLGYTAEEIGTKAASDIFHPVTESIVAEPESYFNVSHTRLSVPFLPTSTPPKSREATKNSKDSKSDTVQANFQKLRTPPVGTPLEQLDLDVQKSTDWQQPMDSLVPITVRRKDGTRYAGEATWSSKLFLGTEEATLVLFRDVTEKHERDIALSNALERARKAEQQTDKVLRFLGHELRNPLHAILLSTEDLLRNANSYPTSVTKSLLEIYATALYKNELIVNVLDFVDLEHGTLRLADPIAYSVGTVISRTLHNVEANMNRNVQITRNMDASLDVQEAIGDPERIAQCLANVCHFVIGCVLGAETSRPGSVHVNVRLDHSIQDVSHAWPNFPPGHVIGCLIAEMQTIGPSELANALHSRRTTGASVATMTEGLDAPGVVTHAFLTDEELDPFSDHFSSTGSGFGAHGLSLVVATRLAALMGGSVTVENVKGEISGNSQFTAVLRIPLVLNEIKQVERSVSCETVHPPEVVSTLSSPWSEGVLSASQHFQLQDFSHEDSGTIGLEEENGTPQRGKTLRNHETSMNSEATHTILIVEDNKLINRLTCKMLQRQGFHVLSAEDGQAAVEMYAASKFDLILMDLHMPRLGGLEAAKELRRLGYSKSILALTAYDTIQDRQECLRENLMQDFVSKPAVEADLIALVRDWLRKM